MGQLDTPDNLTKSFAKHIEIIELLTEFSACFLSENAETEQVTGYASVAHDVPMGNVELNEFGG